MCRRSTSIRIALNGTALALTQRESVCLRGYVKIHGYVKIPSSSHETPDISLGVCSAKIALQ